jgi:hypothetical protein
MTIEERIAKLENFRSYTIALIELFIATSIATAIVYVGVVDEPLNNLYLWIYSIFS